MRNGNWPETYSHRVAASCALTSIRADSQRVAGGPDCVTVGRPYLDSEQYCGNLAGDGRRQCGKEQPPKADPFEVQSADSETAQSLGHLIVRVFSFLRFFRERSPDAFDLIPDLALPFVRVLADIV